MGILIILGLMLVGMPLTGALIAAAIRPGETGTFRRSVDAKPRNYWLIIAGLLEVLLLVVSIKASTAAGRPADFVQAQWALNVMRVCFVTTFFGAGILIAVGLSLIARKRAP